MIGWLIVIGYILLELAIIGAIIAAFCAAAWAKQR